MLFSGKGQSIWDVFTHTARHVIDGATGDEAANSYHDYLKDIAAIVELKVTF